MSSRLTSRQIGYIIGSLTAVLVLGGGVWRAAEYVGELRWNTWINAVHIACQTGSDEAAVKLLLGEPVSVHHPGDTVRGLIPEPPALVDGTRRIFVYSQSFFSQGYWIVHVYLDNKGRVITCYISTS